jgi:hypothetical protein
MALLLTPLACLDDEGPPPFTTAGLCNEGDTSICDCGVGERGLMLCKEDGTFGTCLCKGCTSAPDCEKCSGCYDRCMCESFHASGRECLASCEGPRDSGT